MYGLQINNKIVTDIDDESVPRLVNFGGLVFILMDENEEMSTIISMITLTPHTVHTNQIEPFHGTIILTQ